MVNPRYLTLAQVQHHAIEHNGGSYLAYQDIPRWDSVPHIHHGYFVAMPNGWWSQDHLSHDTLQMFVEQRPLVRLGQHWLGLWKSPANCWYIDESVWIKDLSDARLLQRLWNQLTIWDIEKQEAI